jgi:hypothetical protein
MAASLRGSTKVLETVFGTYDQVLAGPPLRRLLDIATPFLGILISFSLFVPSYLIHGYWVTATALRQIVDRLRRSLIQSFEDAHFDGDAASSSLHELRSVSNNVPA